MSNKKITDLPAYTTPLSSDVVPIVDVSNSITKKTTMASLFNILSSLFRIKDSSDTSKKAAFDVSGITTATTRTITIPDSDLTLVGTDTTQTLTNKTLGTGTKINTTGSDGTGALYYRDAAGLLQPVTGTNGQIISFNASNIPTAIPNPGASDASTSVKGVTVLSTQAKADTGDDTNATTAKNVITPSILRARLLNTGIADTGSANVYVITPSPVITAYTAYQEFTFLIANTNTGASTLAVNGLVAKAIKIGSIALSGGELLAGKMAVVIYDGTAFQLITTNLITMANGIDSIGFTNGTTTKTITHNLNAIPKKIKIDFQLAGSVGMNANEHGGGAGQYDSSGQNCVANFFATPNNLGGQTVSGAVMAHPVQSAGTPDQTVVISSVTTTTFLLTLTGTSGGIGNVSKYSFLWSVEQ